MTDKEIVDFFITELNRTGWGQLARRFASNREDVPLNQWCAITIVRGEVDRAALAEVIGEVFAKRMKARLTK